MNTTDEEKQDNLNPISSYQQTQSDLQQRLLLPRTEPPNTPTARPSHQKNIRNLSDLPHIRIDTKSRQLETPTPGKNGKSAFFVTPPSVLTALTLTSTQPPTPSNEKIRRFKQAVTSKQTLKNNFPIKVAHLSITLFFMGHFFILQSYSDKLADMVIHASDKSKLILELLLVMIMLISFYGVVKTCNDVSQQKQFIQTNNRQNNTMTIALSVLVIAQGLLIIQLFMSFLVEYLVPMFFMLSCLLLIINCSLSAQNKCIKVIFNALFFIEILGTVAIFLKATDIIPAISHDSLWKSYIIPMTVMVSLICAALTTVNLCCVTYEKSIAPTRESPFSGIDYSQTQQKRGIASLSELSQNYVKQQNKH